MQQSPLTYRSYNKQNSTLKTKNKFSTFFEITHSLRVYFNLYLSLIIHFFFIMTFFSFLPYFCILIFFKWWDHTSSRLKLRGRVLDILALLQTYLPVIVTWRPFTKWYYSYSAVSLVTYAVAFIYCVSFFN